jgi:hypothetical protein
MSIAISERGEGDLARELPAYVRQHYEILCDTYGSDWLEEDIVNKYFRSTSCSGCERRACTSEAGCARLSNENEYSNEEQAERGGYLTITNESKFASPNAHAGERGKGSVYRITDQIADSGWHSHIPVKNRAFNPPTPQDVYFFISTNAKTNRKTEFVLCEEAVYVIYAVEDRPWKRNYDKYLGQKLAELQKGEITTNGSDVFKNIVFILMRETFPQNIDELNNYFQNKPMRGDLVPFFQTEKSVLKYLKMFEKIGVCVRKLRAPWNKS